MNNTSQSAPQTESRDAQAQQARGDTQAVALQAPSLHLVAIHPFANAMLAKMHAPLVRKSGFPYFTKLSPRLPKGTKPNAKPAKRLKAAVKRKLGVDEIDKLLE